MNSSLQIFAILCLSGFAQAQAPSCTTHQVPGFMTSWLGQPGTADHSETRPVTLGTHFACLAYANPHSSVLPACFLSFDSGGQYTLLPHHAMRAPQDSNVTLTCNGESPTCCKVQVTPDATVLTKQDKKAAAKVLKK